MYVLQLSEKDAEMLEVCMAMASALVLGSKGLPAQVVDQVIGQALDRAFQNEVEMDELFRKLLNLQQATREASDVRD